MDLHEIEALKTENDELRQQIKALTIAGKRQQREHDLLLRQIERNRISAEARENLSHVIAKKRSELERYMNLLLGNCPDSILLFDQDGCLAYCTDSFLSLCGIPGFGIVGGKSFAQLFAPYTSAAFQTHLQEVFTTIFEEKKAIEFSAAVDFAQSGTHRQYHVQVTPMLGEAGGVEGAIIIFTDTTEIRMAQLEAERANAAKSDFLATVSHEIRTPMNAIIGVADMLKNTSLNGKQQEYLRNIQDSSHVLLNLINDILDFSQIESGKLELMEEYFRLPELLRHLQTMFQLMFQQKHVSFLCEFDAQLPAVILGDDKRIRQIITNLLNNALKYTREGSVTFRVYPGADGMLHIVVRDTGIGIQESALPQLFTAFERLDMVKNKSIAGTGLGLAITKRLCELMHGTIGVESEYGAGSCFTVLLPLQPGTLADLPPEVHREAVEFRAPDARILVVDDIEINLEIVAYMLDAYGVVADYAHDGKQAVEKVMERPYDLILMDHMMPVMDGLEATRIIRSLQGGAGDVPIVALTANAVSSAVATFLDSGFNDFLSKPIDAIALADCLLKWLPPGKVMIAAEA